MSDRMEHAPACTTEQVLLLVLYIYKSVAFFLDRRFI